jgi:hypothetical protein
VALPGGKGDAREVRDGVVPRQGGERDSSSMVSRRLGEGSNVPASSSSAMRSTRGDSAGNMVFAVRNYGGHFVQILFSALRVISRARY